VTMFQFSRVFTDGSSYRMREDEPSVKTRENWNIVTFKDLERLTGKTLRMIFAWRDEYGLPVDSSGSVNKVDLFKFMPWYIEHLKKTLARTAPKNPLNPLQERKIRNLDLDYQLKLGDLLERGQVIGWQISIIQNVINAFAKIPDLVNLIYGQDREAISEVFKDFQDQILNSMQKIPEILCLNDRAQAKLNELFEVMNKE